MKNVILGMMLIAVSAVYSQDSVAAKDRKFQPRMEKQLAPVSLMNVRRDAHPAEARRIQYTGVVQVRNGVAIIVVDGIANNRVYAVNLPKASQVDGHVLRFNMSPSRAQMPEGVKCSQVVVLSDLTELQVK